MAIPYNGRRYYVLDTYLKDTYGTKLKKIAIDAGFTCPNRDGTLGTRGCIFCSEGGSGDFAVSFEQILSNEPYIAYFQAYTCTYAPIDQLRAIYEKALSDSLVKGISIATRPDCLPDPVIALLAELKDRYFPKFIWIELGLQTMHEQTALYIRRGYTSDCFTNAVRKLRQINIPVIVHLILGLPGEDKEMMLQSIQFVNEASVSGIKLQLLHVLRGTDLAEAYNLGQFAALSLDEYTDMIIEALEHLNPSIVIHRITGDGPKELLLAPLFSLNKTKVLNTIRHRMKMMNSYQGKYWKGD